MLIALVQWVNTWSITNQVRLGRYYSCSGSSHITCWLIFILNRVDSSWSVLHSGRYEHIGSSEPLHWHSWLRSSWFFLIRTLIGSAKGKWVILLIIYRSCAPCTFLSLRCPCSWLIKQKCLQEVLYLSLILNIKQLLSLIFLRLKTLDYSLRQSLVVGSTCCRGILRVDQSFQLHNYLYGIHLAIVSVIYLCLSTT